MSRSVRKKAAVVQTVPQTSPSSRIPAWFAAAESWLATRVEWIVWLLVAVGFYLRVQQARGTYMNGDETWILVSALQRGLANVYRAGLVHAYGPVMNFVLHFMTFFGSSEMYFRMPSILAGAVLPFFAYRWVAETFGKGAASVSAVILCFSPELVILSAQVRHYTIHAVMLACALYCLERAFREQSARWMRWFSATLVLAMLTMYISVWFAAALGLYSVVRMARNELPRRLIVEWAVGQAAAAGIFAFGWFTHLRFLQGTGGESFARDVWLRSSYYHPESQTLVGFLRDSTGYLFGWVFANATLGKFMIFAFLAGIALLLWGKAGAPGNRRVTALSLLLPLATAMAAAVIGLFPYGGSRHDAFLALFVAAGVAISISFLARGKLTVLLLAAAPLVPLWLAAAQHHYLDEPFEYCKLEQMTGAVDYLKTRAPQPRVLVMDRFGSASVDYYVCHGRIEDKRSLSPELTTYRCLGYQVLELESWGHPVEDFTAALTKVRQIMPGLFPDPAWVWYFFAPEPGSPDKPPAACRAVFGKIDIRQVSPPAAATCDGLPQAPPSAASQVR